MFSLIHFTSSSAKLMYITVNLKELPGSLSNSVLLCKLLGFCSGVDELSIIQGCDALYCLLKYCVL